MPDEPPVIDWPRLKRMDLPPVDPFPVDRLPPAVANFVEVATKAFGCPADFVACPVLVTAGAAIGRSVSLKLKDGYFASASLYHMNVGGPSSGKSPATEAAVRPLLNIDEQLHAEYRSDRETYEVELEAYNMAPKKEKPPRPIKPTIKSAVLNDATTEAVATHLSHNLRGLMLYHDEGSGWVASMNQYKGGKGSDRQFYLSALYGKASRVDRKGNADHEPLRIPHPFLSVTGNIPPEMLSDLNDTQGRADGFVERILFAVPDPKTKPFWSEEGIPEGCASEWARIVGCLRLMPMNLVDGRDCPYVARFTHEAYARWINWYNTCVDEFNSPGFNQGDLSADNKLQDFAGRFALILHLLEHASEPDRRPGDPLPDVTLRTVEGAIALWSYFRSHQRRARWLMTGGLNDGNAKAVVDWARRNRRDSFSVRDVAADLRWMREAPDGPEGILEAMEIRGFVRRRPDPLRPLGTKGQKPSPVYDVHPELIGPRLRAASQDAHIA
jgi:hypothetical protein